MAVITASVTNTPEEAPFQKVYEISISILL
jgi:hypothetical protein